MALWKNNGIGSKPIFIGNMQLPDKTNNIIPVQLKALIKHLQGLQNSENITNIFKNTANKTEGFRALNDLVYYYKNFIFCKMLRNRSDLVAKNLEFVNNLGIASAPILIDHIKVDDIAGVIITSFQNCKEQLPIPYPEYKVTVGSLDNEAKEQFLKDTKTLLDNKKLHPFALEGPSRWLVSTESGKIILENWSLLQDLNNLDKEKVVLKIREILSTH